MMTRVIHPAVESWLLFIPMGLVTVLCYIITIIFVIDFTLSFKAALDIRDILVRMEKAKEELELMKRRLDVMIAVAGDTAEDYRMKLDQKLLEFKAGREADVFLSKYRLEELLQSVQERFDSLQEKIRIHKPGSNEEMGEERAKLHARFFSISDQRRHLWDRLGFYKRNLLNGNPTATSRQFQKVLDELKEAALKHMKK